MDKQSGTAVTEVNLNEAQRRTELELALARIKELEEENAELEEDVKADNKRWLEAERKLSMAEKRIAQLVALCQAKAGDG